jgi:uncharacterized protein (PEP-CTERM system associated)
MTITMGSLRRSLESGHTFLSNFPPALAPLAVLVLLASPACHAEWKFTANVGLSETYTDNVNLSNNATAKSDFISEFIPGFILEDKGPNFQLSAAYQLHYFEYSDNNVAGVNRQDSQLQAIAKATLIKEFLYIDSNASISQQSLSAFGPQVNDNAYSSANRTEVKMFGFSPYITERFDSTATAELRYSHNILDSGEATLGNSQADSVLFNLASGPAFRLVSWGLQFNRQTVDNTVAPTITSETTSANLKYLISPAFSLTANVGYDKFEDPGLGTSESKGFFWLAGFSWAPTQRTSLEASAGRRFFGSTYALAARHHSRHSVWIVNYSDAVTSTLSQFSTPTNISTAALLSQLDSATISDPALLQQAVAAYMSNTGIPPSQANNISSFNTGFFRQKQWQASTAFNTARSTLLFNVFDTEMTGLPGQQSSNLLFANSGFLLNDFSKQLGGSAMLNWQISPRSNAYLNTTYTKFESLSTDLTSNNRAIRLGMTRQMRPKIKGTIEVRRVEGSAVNNAGNYHEDAVMASLSMQL